LGTAAAAATTDFAAAVHAHAASDVTTGTFDNARINFAAPSSIGSTTAAAGTFTTLTANSGTITASTPLAVTQTWNDSATFFRAIQTNITNTQSQTESYHLACNVGGSIVAYIRRDGRIVAGANVYGGSGLESALLPQGVAVGNASYIGFCSNSFANDSGGDLRLFRDAANVLAQRNAANAQTLRIYTTSGTATEYLFLRGQTGNAFQIGTVKGGTGSARALELSVNGNRRIYITDSGQVGIGSTTGALASHGLFVDVPASNSTLTSGGVTIRGSTAVTLDNGGDPILRVQSSRVMFGGTTSLFPALKRSSTVLQARLADDTDFCPLQGQIRIHQNAVSETITATHTLTLFDAAGTAYKVPCVAA
jgi:hypothetical protein